MTARRQPFRQVQGLDPQSNKLQDSVLDWITRQWGAATAPFGVPTPIKHADYSAKFGELVCCDATAGAFSVRLPKITADRVGGVVSVKDVSGSANVVTVRPGAASDSLGDSDSVELSEWAGCAFVALTPTLWGQM